MGNQKPRESNDTWKVFVQEGVHFFGLQIWMMLILPTKVGPYYQLQV